MKIWALIINDRHRDPEVELFLSASAALDAALDYINVEKRDNPNSYAAVLEEERHMSREELTTAGWLFFEQYSVEGDNLRVEALELKGEPSEAVSDKKYTAHDMRLVQRKLDKRDRRIAGMQREIDRLEKLLLNRIRDIENIPNLVRDAVTHVLCNVRIVPVGGFLRDSKILDINVTSAPKPKA